MVQGIPNMGFGPSAEVLSTSGREYLWSRVEGHWMKKTIVISSVARYSGSMVLPKGLALGKITASGKYKEYTDGLSDGSEVFRGFLDNEQSLAGADGNALDAAAVMVVFGR